MKFAHHFVENQKSRRLDNRGSGQYGARRRNKDGSARLHKGLDIVTTPGQKIFAPFPAKLIRVGIPYSDAPKFKLIELQGIGDWKDYKVKILYISPTIGKNSMMQAGDLIGYSQNIKSKHKGITNHIHVEIYKKKVHIDPRELYGMCF